MTDAIAFFDRLADGWDERYRKNNFRARLELLNRMVAAPQGGKLWLDAGCGTATVARWLMRERGARVVAIDASTRMLANAGRVDGSAFLCCSDATNLGVRSGVFDAVVCLSVLEYVERPPALLAELGRVLKPGGTLIISVPHATLSVELPLTVGYWLSGVLRRGRRFEFREFPKHRYSRVAMTRLLEAAGFTVNEVCEMGTLPVAGRVRLPTAGTALFAKTTRRDIPVVPPTDSQ